MTICERKGSVAAVAFGSFTLVTSEMLPVGLLTPLASDFDVPDGLAGLTMTVPGLVAAVAAPALTVLVRSRDRRTVLCALMVLLAVADLLTALSPVFAVVLAARVLVGVAIGGFWAFAAGLPPRLVPERRIGRAAAMIAGGIGVASVLGVPAGALILAVAGWRAAFGAAALLALIALAALVRALPPLPAEAAVRPAEVVAAWRSPALRPVLVATALVVTGHFAAYTYVRPFLEEVAGAGPVLVGVALLGYGVAGVAGNFLVGRAAVRDPGAAMAVLAALIAVATALLAPVGAWAVAAVLLLLLLWGVAYGGVSVTGQIWVVGAGGGEAGTALLSSVFNAAIAAGALLGGRVVDISSPRGVMAAGAVLAGLAAWRASRTSVRRRTPSPGPVSWIRPCRATRLDAARHGGARKTWLGLVRVQPFDGSQVAGDGGCGGAGGDVELGEDR
ncbi:MFS transporter [Actinocorallia longicatena]